MSPTALSVCLAIAASAALGVYLRLRQIIVVERNRLAPPEDFAQTISIVEHRRAADYTAAGARLAIGETIYHAALSLAWLSFGLGPLYAAVARLTDPGLTRSLVIVLCFAALGEALASPFSAAETFWLDAKFGLNRQSVPGFLADAARSLALQLAIVAPLLYALFAAVRMSPDYWHIYAFLGFMLVVFGLVALYPTLIAPLFNKFTPLPEGELRNRLERLLERCGFEAGGLYVMDASTRSSRGNAYFAGLGSSRRIVLFDTLIRRHSAAEIESVVAHEIGHYKHGHLRHSLVLMAGVTLAGFFALRWALGPSGLAAAFVAPADPGLGLVIALLAKDPILHVLSPLFAWRSRRAEFEADAYARSLVGQEPMIAALTRLMRDNLATLTPDRIYAQFYYSHPPASVRVARLRETG